MTALLNKRKELFAQALAEGLTQDAAYVTAGYSPKQARAAASDLLRKDKTIKPRVLEIRKDKGDLLTKAGMVPVLRAARVLGIDKERLLKELWDNAMQAKAAIPVLDKNGVATGVYNANWAASNKALELIGREFGMFMPKEEVQVNEYANKTTKEILLEIEEKCRKMGIKIEVPMIEGESIRVS